MNSGTYGITGSNGPFVHHRNIKDPRSTLGTIRGSSGVKNQSIPECNKVSDAFYMRAWLVELVYECERFVVSVTDDEATTPREAVSITINRAAGRDVVDRLGRPLPLETAMLPDLRYPQSVRVLPDCLEARERLAVGGPREPDRIGILPWYDAEPVAPDQFED